MSNQSFVGEDRVYGELFVSSSTDSFRAGTVWELPDRAAAEQLASVMNQLRVVGLGLVRRCSAIDSPLQEEQRQLLAAARIWQLSRDGMMTQA